MKIYNTVFLKIKSKFQKINCIARLQRRVAPGGVATKLHALAGAPERIDRLAQVTPIGRAAEAKEIAEVVSWALLDAPDYVTGTTIDVAGGL